MGEYTLPSDYKPEIHVVVNPEEKTLKFIDNGLGMTADEVEEYTTRSHFPVQQISLKIQRQSKRRSDHRSLRTWLLLRIHGS